PRATKRVTARARNHRLLPERPAFLQRRAHPQPKWLPRAQPDRSVPHMENRPTARRGKLIWIRSPGVGNNLRKENKMPVFHPERHRTQHIGWLRAAVLGANDGIVSTASLVVGVAASNATHTAVLVAGVAGLVAGAMSMAAGEYVTVSSQLDTVQADIERERKELEDNEPTEIKELAAIYVKRGLDSILANQVAEQLMA